MINIYKFESDTEENCRLKCLEELDVYNNEILTKEYEEDNLYKLEVVKKEDVKAFIREYLTKVTTEMGVSAKVEINEDEDVFTVKMFSDNNPILIGKDGRTLSSLQHLLRQTLSNQIKFNVKGYGHGVGLSQTGSDSLAKQGYNCEDIIRHFYTGVEVVDF